MRSLWFLFHVLHVLLAAAGQTNHSIDDASGLVNYSPLSAMGCVGCKDASLAQLQVSEAHNGTLSLFSPLPVTMELNFTGTALYIFFALQESIGLWELTFSLDGVQVGSNSTPFVRPAEYNVSVYTNTSLSDGFHRFVMNLDPTPLLDGSVGGPMAFDYALYTSNDPDLGSGSPSSTTQATLLPSSNPPSHPSKKAPVGAIAGAIVGTLVLVVAFILAFMAVQRARRKKRRNTPGMEESGQLSTDALVVSKEVLAPATSPSGPVEVYTTDHIRSPLMDTLDTAHVPPPPVEPLPTEAMTSVATQEEFRLLREQLEQLRQRMDGSSAVTTGSETASLERSLSTMKREQTRALQSQGQGGNVTDTLVHTDSGLRLTAGRAVNELPPSYVAD
ncbi:hypothetical protein DFH06DRAFT_357736 [Mycena polygramma]|nr:hypothetical protein DFH06DRAFT_357736 [Mycena polygramma]